MIPSVEEAKLYGRIHQLEALNVELVKALEEAQQGWCALNAELAEENKKLGDRWNDISYELIDQKALKAELVEVLQAITKNMVIATASQPVRGEDIERARAAIAKARS